MTTPVQELSKLSSLSSVGSPREIPVGSFGGDKKWSTEEFIRAHELVKKSGKHNFQGCRIQVPTTIRYDRLRQALAGRKSEKNELMLNLLEFGMPICCNSKYGIRKPQRNHGSATNFKNEINEYFYNGLQAQEFLGPFEASPIAELRYSPIMSVPKEDHSRRVIVDFSYPPGKSINDGISTSSYLEFKVEFSLPSISSMVDRLNQLGPNSLLYKRDLKGAFRQFPSDPGDFCFAGLRWDGSIYLDTRLAMGLRSSAFCCQGVTEMVAKVIGDNVFVLVYFDDFGGAEDAETAQVSYEQLGEALQYFGLVEAKEKAVAPTTKMD